MSDSTSQLPDPQSSQSEAIPEALLDPMAVPPPVPIRRSFAAQQAGIIASMARAHEKMLREIYYQKLQRSQIRQMEAENKDLKKKVESLEKGQHLKKNFGAQQAGIIASMAKAHEKMLREIYYQKLQRGRNKNMEKENAALKQKVEELEKGANLKRNFGAQQAGIIASMARAHEKMLREIYYQKLQRKKNSQNESRVEDLQAKMLAMEKENNDLKELNVATTEHSEAAQALIEENKRLKKELEAAKGAPRTGGGQSVEVDTLVKANKRLEVENMRLERRVHELEGIPVRPGSPVDDRLHELEHRVRDLEMSPHGEPRGSHSPVARGGPAILPPPMEATPQHPSMMHSSPVAPTPVTGHSPLTRSPAAQHPASQAPKPFTVRVACDVHGVKYNVRLSFIGVPTLNTLINSVDNYFDVVARVNHPPGCPDVPFSLAALQIFDINAQRWVNLTDPYMITGDAQLFAFQPASVWHPDRPGTIPVPEVVETWTALSAGPKRCTIAEVPTKSAMIINVFKDMDCMNEGVLQFTDFRDALLRYGMELTTSTVGELFNRIDSKKDGVITTDEWVEYCRDNPRFVESVFCKAHDARTAANTPYPPSQHRALSPSQYERYTSLRDAQADRRPMSMSHSPRY